ncbi:DNA mismatch repair endonuclease MutL [Membranihabitans marinus]|uniref:DNA mismatch repair endonuclease MutL n=1 Tax=Membranihabitans marinus TaxID=1227546 RepID=UPI001F00A5F1|nr:DNA mismatch repair endonuclease MutL [Membranihabitans marinus]
MEGVIKMLPDKVANQIAAGEVVERPSSVVKELLENAIDAGATKIEVVIKDAGKTLIQIKDNGSGMSEMDARMCVERHATSKIKTGDDLSHIYTLGFRGEALPSIASISQTKIETRLHEEELGYVVKVEGSKITQQDYCQATPGTTITVQQLFYNTPARRKFLKSDTVEFKHILDEFQHMALANPEVYFSLHHNDRLYHQLYPGPLKQRIVQIFGNHYENKLIHLQEQTEYLHVNGFIGKPENAKKSRGEQFVFVNNRFIKSHYLNHAVYQAYGSILAEKTYPFFCVFLQIDPDKIDVNVHPAKHEIKFEDEKFIFNLIRAAVKHALVQHSVPVIDFDQNPGFQFKAQSNSIDTKFSKGLGQTSVKQSRPTEERYSPHKKEQDWSGFYNDVKQTSQEVEQNLADDKTGEIEFKEESTFTHFEPIQIKKSYILSSIKSGILLVDQQNAHERILFEKLLHERDKISKNTQTALFPEVIKLNAVETEILENLLPTLKAFGFVIEPFGVRTFIIQGSPEILLINNSEQVSIIRQLIDEFADYTTSKMDINEIMAQKLAKNLCVKRNQLLKQPEMQQIINQLFASLDPTVSPSGKKCFVTLKSEDLEKLFA